MECRLDIPVTQELVKTTRVLCTYTALSLFTIDQFSSFPLDIIIEELRFLYRWLVERCGHMQQVQTVHRFHS